MKVYSGCSGESVISSGRFSVKGRQIIVWDGCFRINKVISKDFGVNAEAAKGR